MTRTPEQLFAAFELATKESPLLLTEKEVEVFSHALRKQNESRTSDGKLTVFNRDVLFQNPVKSPVDGKHYTNRKTYDDHLKAHGCFEIGTEKVSDKKRELRGDFNAREELTKAVHQHIR